MHGLVSQLTRGSSLLYSLVSLSLSFLASIGPKIILIIDGMV
jgi:hypothetical protein